MNCPKCGLPQMHGFVGYAGPQCKCQWANPIQCGPVFTAIPEDELKQLREQIATLTRQRDLAIEALEKALRALIHASAHVDNEDFVKVMMARDTINETLSTIKESEAK